MREARTANDSIYLSRFYKRIVEGKRQKDRASNAVCSNRKASELEMVSLGDMY